MTDSLRKTETSSLPPVRERTSDVFSYPPSASPFDQNSKLWESVMPPPRPPLYAVVKRRVGALSEGLFQLPVTGTLTNLAERLPAKIPGWQRLGYAARWSILTGAGMALAFMLTWSLSRSGPSEADTSAALTPTTGASQTAHALKPAALPAVPVAVATPEPETTRIPASSMPNPDDVAGAPAEAEPSDKPAAKTKPAKSKKKLAKSKARSTKKARATRTASR
jgi:hypothetical protein